MASKIFLYISREICVFLQENALWGGGGMVRVVVLSENRDRSQDMLYDCICVYSTDACNRASARCRTH